MLINIFELEIAKKNDNFFFIYNTKL